MGIDIINYLSNKSVKLSDAFYVKLTCSKKFDIYDTEIGFPDAVDVEKGFELYLNTVVSVTLPAIPTSVSSVRYNGFTKSMTHPDFNAPPETLKITLFETSDYRFERLINYLLKQNGYNEYGEGSIKNPKDYNNSIKAITVGIYDNNLSEVISTYRFGMCSLASYTYQYQHDYKSNSLPLIDLEFTYRQFGIKF